jgi:hypothetical protein
VYAELNSPLPNLTVHPFGCHSCGMRGLGDDPPVFDTTPTDPGGDLIPPDLTPPVLDTNPVPVDIVPPDLSAGGPSTIGDNFISVGGGNYLNLQTGQTVPQSIAEEVTAASTGAGTANLQPTTTEGTVTLTDPNTGITSSVATNNLSTAAAALAAAGKLVNSVGQLTAEGQALAHSGNLYNPLPQTGVSSGVSAALSNLSSWFTQSSLIPGIPNAGVLGGGLVAIVALSVVMNSKPKRRRR